MKRMYNPRWGLAAPLLLLLTGCSVNDADSIVSQSDPSVQVLKSGPIAFSVDYGSESDSTANTRTIRNTIMGKASDDVVSSSAMKDGLSLTCTVSPMAPVATTRASVVGETTLSTMQDGADGGFGVFGSYTGMHKYSAVTVKPDFMYNEHVYWDSTSERWAYSPLRYWPNGEGDVDGVNDNVPYYVSFFGYAPFSDGVVSDGDYADQANGILTKKGAADYCIPYFSFAHEEGDPWLMYRIIDQANLDKQVDLLYAQKLDQTKTAYDANQAGIVDLTFNHALACFGERVQVMLNDDLQNLFNVFINSEIANQEHAIETIEANITKLQIEYTLTDKARLVLWNQGAPHWQPLLSEQMTSTRSVDLITGTAPHRIYYLDLTGDSPQPVHTPWLSTAKGVNKGIFAIPLETDGFPQKAVVKTSYEIRINGVLEPNMSKTDVAHTIYLKDYYDKLISGGQQLGFNIWFTFPLPSVLASLKALAPLLTSATVSGYIGKCVDVNGCIEGIDDTQYNGAPAGIIVGFSAEGIQIAAASDGSAAASWEEASLVAASKAPITGASSWRLPSQTQLSAVGSVLALGDGYWSSTEDVDNSDNAYYWNGSTMLSGPKTDLKKVRAICVY